MNRKDADTMLSAFEGAVRGGDRILATRLRAEILDAMVATTIEQNVGTIEKGANVTGVKIDRLG